MPLPERDTIFALSSGRPPAAIAVIRVCGPRAGEALKRLTGRLPKPRQVALVRVRDPESAEVIDEAVALWFPGPASETGEDMAELQLHGGRAVVAAALRTLGSLDGLRPAEAGEFTRRAFENGKLDLTAVEGLADLVAAETDAQRRQAYRQLKGLLGDRAEAWRARLIEAMALVEARIDFSDEADVPEDLAGPALKIAQGLRDEIAAVLAGSGRGERLREGLVVAITGPPNVGKSTLLNRIAQREVAIVSPFAGTTRDVIEVHLDLDGYPVTLLDTAGMRESEDPVEQEGVRRARDRASQADLVVWVEDARDRATQEHSSRLRGIGGGARSKADLGPAGNGESIGSAGEASAAEAQWVVWNKADLLDIKNKSEALNYRYHFIVSAVTGIGIAEFLAALTAHVARQLGGASNLVTRERHREALERAVEALQRALLSPNEDIIAEDLRSAARALGKLTGRVDVEDVLDRIFGQFCIGK